MPAPQEGTLRWLNFKEPQVATYVLPNGYNRSVFTWNDPGSSTPLYHPPRGAGRKRPLFLRSPGRWLRTRTRAQRRCGAIYSSTCPRKAAVAAGDRNRPTFQPTVTAEDSGRRSARIPLHEKFQNIEGKPTCLKRWSSHQKMIRCWRTCPTSEDKTWHQSALIS